MGKKSTWIDQYKEETADLTNRTGRRCRCRMLSQFSCPILRLHHDILHNCCRSAATRVSLGGADGATSSNHLAASRTLPRKAAARRRGRLPLVAEEAVVGSWAVVAASAANLGLFGGRGEDPLILENYQDGIGRPSFPICFIYKQGGPEGWAGNSKFQVPPLRSRAGKERLWIMDPNVSDPNERPLGCRTQTSVTLHREASCWLGCPCHHRSWNWQTHTGLYFIFT
jgi:hypothetical protein